MLPFEALISETELISAVNWWFVLRNRIIKPLGIVIHDMAIERRYEQLIRINMFIQLHVCEGFFLQFLFTRFCKYS